MRVGFFRKIRRLRVIRLEEDLDFGIKKIMRERWDLLYLIEFYQNLEELESILRKETIVEKDANEIFLREIEKIKKDHPFDKKLILPHWDYNHFINDIIWLSGTIKLAVLFPSENIRELPFYHPIARAWALLEGFTTAVEKRRETLEDQEQRITSLILIASKKHIYYMELFITIAIIVIGVVIGWLFSFK